MNTNFIVQSGQHNWHLKATLRVCSGVDFVAVCFGNGAHNSVWSRIRESSGACFIEFDFDTCDKNGAVVYIFFSGGGFLRGYNM